MMRILLPLLLCLAPVPPAQADEDHDHDLARAALARGEIVALSSFLPALEARIGGHLLDVHFEVEHGLPIYEVKLITTDGRVVEAKVDAATGKLAKVKAPRPQQGEHGSDEQERDD